MNFTLFLHLARNNEDISNMKQLNSGLFSKKHIGMIKQAATERRLKSGFYKEIIDNTEKFEIGDLVKNMATAEYVDKNPNVNKYNINFLMKLVQMDKPGQHLPLKDWLSLNRGGKIFFSIDKKE